MVERREVATADGGTLHLAKDRSKYHHELSAVDRGETIPNIGAPCAGKFGNSDCQSSRGSSLDSLSGVEAQQ